MWRNLTKEKDGLISLYLLHFHSQKKKIKKKWLEFIHRTLVIKDVFSIGKHAGEYAAEEKPA